MKKTRKKSLKLLWQQMCIRDRAAPVQKTIGLKSDANYAIVDAAIQKANGLNRENYKDFSKVDADVYKRQPCSPTPR